MKVAIIGAGNVGKALGTSIGRAGHDVTLSAGSAESASAAAGEVGARAATDSVSAVRDADLVLLAVPYVGAGKQVAAEIAEAARGRVVVDATNPIKPDYSGLATNGTSGAEEFQRRMPGARVVKAFNTIFASNQANPARDIDGFVAGDDADAKQTVLGLIDAMGFTPVDVGPLSQARHLEGMAWVNIGLNSANGWSWSSAWRLENKG
jgi:8-hydroxy-5-deazaflavin:NADPH oxidoreductase